jgi:hypothetical protein
MFELIDIMDMKEGEIYFIKRFDYIEELIFVKYQIPKFAVFKHSDCPTCFAVLLNKSVYKYINEQEYKAKLKRIKLKEKYNVKLLDIVLKRLVELFE